MSRLWALALVTAMPVPARAANLDELYFVPPEPRPGAKLQLSISLLPEPDGASPGPVQVRLMTWTDLDADCAYASAGERRSYPALKVRDNDAAVDREPAAGEILADVYTVPATAPPRKYTAVVTAGEESRSISLVVPAAEPDSCSAGPAVLRQARPSRASWMALRKLGGIVNIFSKRSVRELRGEVHLFVYDLEAKRFSRLAKAAQGTLAEPSWSFDGRRLAVVLDEGGKRLLLDVARDGSKVVPLTSGPDDHEPHWLPDGRRLLFFRASRLHVLDTVDGRIAPLAFNGRLDHLLAVLPDEKGGIALLYEAPDPEITVNPTQDFFLLRLTAKLVPQGEPLHLVQSPAWLLLGQFSPQGDQIVFCQQDQPFIGSLATGESKPLADDDHVYLAPRWSPDGGAIALLSSRGE